MVVTVAPAGYTGQADYYCDGVNDDVLINAAIQYVSGAYGGGTVHLLDGTFNTSSYIEILSNVSLEGSGAGTIILTIPSTVATGLPTISMSGTSGLHKINTALKDMRLKNTYPVHAYYSDNVVIQGVTFFGAPRAGLVGGSNWWVDAEECDNVVITGCTVDGNSETFDTNTNACIAFFASNNSRIVSNTIKNIITTNTNDFYAIAMQSTGSPAQIIANDINTISGTVAGKSVYGIFVALDRTMVQNNKIQNMSTATAANAFGIILTASSTSSSVIGNYCFNNGDTGIANTNGNNFSDAGTSTQVHSNSWQPIQDAYTTEVAYTPTFTGFGTVSAVNFTWTRVGNHIRVTGVWTSGTCTAVEARISFPNSLVSDSSLITSLTLCGKWTRKSAPGVTGDTAILIESGVGYVTFGQNIGGAGGGLNKGTGSVEFSNNDTMSLWFELPVSGWNI